MPSLGHWKFPKSRSGRRSISVTKLLENEALGKLFKKRASATHDYEFADNEYGLTGIPARLKPKRLELPTRGEEDRLPKAAVEHRQDQQGTLVVGNLGTPGAFDDLGKVAMKDKFARAFETLGQLSRTWEVPSSDEPLTAALANADHHGPFGVTLSDIGAQGGDEWEGEGHANPEATTGKTASMFESFIEELGTLNAVTPHQLEKAAEVTREQAQSALQKLDELEHQRPTLGQLGRGALVGSMVGPIASNVNRLISTGQLQSPREIAGGLAGGAIFGIATPLLKHKVETSTERHALRDYVNQGHGGRLTTQIENKLETP